MSELIRLIAEKWQLFPIQIIIIVVNVYLVVKSELNYCLLLSLVLVLSTVVLQTVRRRFLLLYPVNLTMNRRSSAHADTYYLRVILILSTLFLTIGFSLINQDRFIGLDNLIGKLLPYSVILFIVVAPLIFCFLSERINEAIAQKLKNAGPSLSIEECPFCSEKFALYERTIISKEKIGVKIKCLKCDKSTLYELSANIGE